MLSLEICKKILNQSKRKYKDEEIKLLREFLYQIAGLQLEFDSLID